MSPTPPDASAPSNPRLNIRAMLVFLVATTADFIKVLLIRRRLTSAVTQTEIWTTGQQPQDLVSASTATDVKVDLWIHRNSWKPNLTARRQVPGWLGGMTMAARKNRRALRRRIRTGPGKPALVVHGDTMSAAWGIYLARLLKVDLIHVEAGLRSGRILDPFPEELSRRMIGRYAQIHYAPTESAAMNLERHGSRVVVTFGNSVIDSVRDTQIRQSTSTQAEDYALVSLHRSELLSNSAVLRQTLDELLELSQEIDLHIVLDSLALAALERYKLIAKLANEGKVQLLEKMPHTDFLEEVHGAAFVITDSGGLQEECAYLGVPCLVHRRTTERDDGLGRNVVLSEWSKGAIVNFSKSARNLKNPIAEARLSPSEIILEDLIERGYVLPS